MLGTFVSKQVYRLDLNIIMSNNKAHDPIKKSYTIFKP
jgi:hypothetical protein